MQEKDSTVVRLGPTDNIGELCAFLTEDAHRITLEEPGQYAGRSPVVYDEKAFLTWLSATRFVCLVAKNDGKIEAALLAYVPYELDPLVGEGEFLEAFKIAGVRESNLQKLLYAAHRIAQQQGLTRIVLRITSSDQSNHAQVAHEEGYRANDYLFSKTI